MTVATIKEFGLAVNDLGKVYPITIKDTDGNRIDLTGGSIVCSMRLIDSTTLTINEQSAGITIDPDQVNNKGEAEYQWQTGETVAAGRYYIWFKVTPSGGKPLTYPDQATQGRAVVEIFDN